MGGHATKPSNKSMVDRLVERSSFIHSPEIEGVFRAVDRAMYFEIEEGENTDPYEDDPWKRGNLHISAPCIYARVVGALKLKSGLSFLNMGSGTGYLNTLIGLLIGPNGINHGIELHEDVVEYAYKKLEQFKAKSRALDKYDFSEPIFIKGNCLNLNPNLRYDRIYLGAACLLDMEDSIKRLVKPNGGILVMPFGNRLMRHTRISENEWKTESLMEVNFTQMIGQGEDTIMIDMPKPIAKSLKELCRIAIRQQLREKTDTLYPNLLNSDNIDHRRARQMKAQKLMLRAKKPAGSSESNNNICSMSSSSSMSRDKATCHCPNAESLCISNGDNGRINNQFTNRISRGREMNSVVGATSNNSAIILGRGDNNQSIIMARSSATASRESKSASGSCVSRVGNGRVVTRSASKLLIANTDATSSTVSNNAGNCTTNDSQATQSSSGTASSGACSRGGIGDNDEIGTLPSQSNRSRRLSFRPNNNSSNSNNARDQYRKNVASSSDSSVGESSGVDEYDEDYDNLNIVNNMDDNNSRYPNHCARTRPYQARSGHHSDAFSGIIMGNYSRGTDPRRRHPRQLRWATLSEPDESDSMDSDNMSPLREPWCVARQLRTHRARFLHLRRVANSSGDNPIGRINIDATPSNSESSLTSFADLILGDECISSGDDSWDNPTSATSEFDDDSFSDEDDDFNDDGEDNHEGNRFCTKTIRGIGQNIIDDEEYHDDANDIDGILDDSILANSIESQSSQSSSSPSSSESDSPCSISSSNVLRCNSNDKQAQSSQGTSSGMACSDRLGSSRHESINTKPSSSNDEPVARRLRSRGLDLPSKLLVVDDTSENPESSASGRSDHENTTAGEGCFEPSSARTRPILPIPSTSLASSPHQSRSLKHSYVLSSRKRSSQMCANINRGNTINNVNCVRMNHRNHRHCRRHCKEAQCQTSNSPMQSTSSSVLPKSGRLHSKSSNTGAPSASSFRNFNTTGGTFEEVDLTSSNESLNTSAATNNDTSIATGTQGTERKRKRRSSSESSETPLEPSPYLPPPMTSPFCQHRPLASRSKRGPRRRITSRHTRCSCSQRSHQTNSAARLDQSNEQGAVSDAINRAAANDDNDDQSALRRSIPPEGSRNDEYNNMSGRASIRTKFVWHNTWSNMLHREIPTLDVLTRLSLRGADPLGRLPPLQSGSAVSCLASFWPQMSPSACANQRQRRVNVQSQNGDPTSNNGSSRRPVSGIGLISPSSGSDIANRMNRDLRPVSSAMEPSDGGDSSAQQAPRQRVNCCCCRYCRNVRRSRRERKQQLHNQSRRVDEIEARHRSSYRRRGRRRRETESEKYFTHMSGYIRQLPIPRVLHDYLNFDRGF